jgi:cation/acetate symporter
MIGAPVCLVTMVVVSLMTKEPDDATQKMVDDCRVPSGRPVIGKQH